MVDLLEIGWERWARLVTHLVTDSAAKAPPYSLPPPLPLWPLASVAPISMRSCWHVFIVVAVHCLHKCFFTVYVVQNQFNNVEY